MKRIIVTICLLLTINAANAASLIQPFTVDVALSSTCRVHLLTSNSISFGTYAALDPAIPPSPSVTFSIACTRNLAAPTFEIDNVVADATTPFYGVLAGLNYSVIPTQSLTTPGAPATPVAGGVGTPDIRTITLTGSIDAGQAGECSANTALACGSTPSSVVHVLKVVY